jgi:NAD(P)H-hydrate epimerase
MMQNAGHNLAKAVMDAFYFIEGGRVLGLVGPGNNGGDTLVALEKMARNEWQTTAYIAPRRKEGDPLVKSAAEAGVVIVKASDDEDNTRLAELIRSHNLVLDGLLGTGIKLPLKIEIAQVLQSAKDALADIEQPPYVIAVDCPSGVDTATGEAAPQCLKSDLTVTMAAVKAGLLEFPAYNLVGDLKVVGIGLEEDDPRSKTWQSIQRQVVEVEEVKAVLPPRPLDAHKGTFGTALIIAGSVNYTGAALLAASAAYRSGAGLVTLGVPEPLHAALAGQIPEATWVLLPHELGVISETAVQTISDPLQRATAVLIGPGFGLEDTTRRFLEKLFVPARKAGRGMGFVHSAEKVDASQKDGKLPPLVLDADALKLVAKLPDWPNVLPPQTILTPHPGEMSVLTGASKDEIQADRIATAEKYAREWNQVVVLKGAFTVIASPKGLTRIIPVASPALARAGTGDVLAGLIVGLRAQGLPAFEAAWAGAWIHAQAGLRAAENLGTPVSVLAGDLLQGMVEVLGEIT